MAYDDERCLTQDQRLTKVETKHDALRENVEQVVARLQLVVEQFHTQNVMLERLSADVRFQTAEMSNFRQSLKDDYVTKAEHAALARFVKGAATVVGFILTGIVVFFLEVLKK